MVLVLFIYIFLNNIFHVGTIFNSIALVIELNIVPTWNMLFKKIYINRTRTIYLNLDENSYIKNKILKNESINNWRQIENYTQELLNS
jgi:hypothetical protein